MYIEIEKYLLKSIDYIKIIILGTYYIIHIRIDPFNTQNFRKQYCFEYYIILRQYKTTF